MKETSEKLKKRFEEIDLKQSTMLKMHDSLQAFTEKKIHVLNRQADQLEDKLDDLIKQF